MLNEFRNDITYVLRYYSVPYCFNISKYEETDDVYNYPTFILKHLYVQTFPYQMFTYNWDYLKYDYTPPEQESLGPLLDEVFVHLLIKKS